MNTSIIFAVVCAASSVACNLKCFGECDDWDDDCSEHHHGYGGDRNTGGRSGGTGASGGSGATGNESGGSANASNTGGTGNTAGSTAGKGGTQPVPSSCTQESDCARGFNCDYERRQCVAAGAETCPELSTEADCDNRNDCKTIYAGTNCSCGPECTCIGGEPGCVCQSFSFFTCEPLEG